MLADHLTKPLQKHMFSNFWSIIMNFSRDTPDSEMSWYQYSIEVLSPNPQDCVGSRVEGKYVDVTVAHFKG